MKRNINNMVLAAMLAGRIVWGIVQPSTVPAEHFR